MLPMPRRLSMVVSLLSLVLFAATACTQAPRPADTRRAWSYEAGDAEEREWSLLLLGREPTEKELEAAREQRRSQPAPLFGPAPPAATTSAPSPSA
jgi:hypothetical protein